MPHSLLKSLKLNLAKYAAVALAYAEGIARRYAEKKILEILDKLRTACPPPKVLNSMGKTLDRVDSLVSSANRRAKKLHRLTKALGVMIDLLKVAIDILSHNPVQTTLGLPPGPAGGVIFSLPQGVVQSQSAKLKWLTETLEDIENENDNIEELLRNFDLIFVPLQAKIALIRTLLNRCSANPNLTADEREEILKGVDIETNSDTEYKSTSGSIYTIKVVTDPNSPSIAPQRQAVAYDYRGIAVLKGPLSFAGDSKVLIKEIKFRIDNQLP